MIEKFLYLVIQREKSACKRNHSRILSPPVRRVCPNETLKAKRRKRLCLENCIYFESNNCRILTFDFD